MDKWKKFAWDGYIVLWCWSSIKRHRLLRNKTIPFWIMLISRLIAVGAPGNNVRYSATTGLPLNIVRARIGADRMMAAIRDSEEGRVEVGINQVAYSSPILQLPMISNNGENCINIAVAKYFCKEAVIVRIKEL